MIESEALLNDWKKTGSISTGPETAAYCAESFRRACTPRPPKPAWFGTGLGQWSDWHITWVDYQGIERECTLRNVKYCASSMLTRLTWPIPEAPHHSSLAYDCITGCLPVMRKGYGPAGWQVVGE